MIPGSMTGIMLAIICTVSVIIYYISGIFAPKTHETPDKTKSYACGEDFPSIRPMFYTGLFLYAFLFIALGGALCLLIISYSSVSLYPLIYLAIIGTTTFTLLLLYKSYEA